MSSHWVPLYSADATAIEQNYNNHAELIREGDDFFPAYMLMRNTRCAALRKNVHGLLECSIYEHRPKACRDFRAGSAECASETATKHNALRRWHRR